MSTRYDCLISAGDRSLLLEPDGPGWSLPHVLCEQGWIADAVGAIRAGIRERCGIEVAVLREIQRTEDAVACELEALATEPGGAWHDAGGSAVESLPPGQREAVRRWRQGEGTERRLSPWQRRGWFEEARQWMTASLREAGMAVTDPVTPVKGAWNGSMVLRAGPCYLKAVPKQIPGEPAVLRMLAARWARHLPAVIASDEERGWLLMHELGGPALDPEDAPGSAEAAGLMARIQIDQAPLADRWLAMGCPDRGLEALERRLPRLLVDIPGRLAAAGVLDASARERLASTAPAVGAACRGLLGHAIPSRSIHHEDFRSGNVHRAEDGTPVIIDWNETVVAHPFFSLHRFLWFMPPPGENDELRDAVRDAYLEPFAAFEPKEKLLEAFGLSTRLAPLYALLYFDSAFDVDEALRRGLGPEEARNARGLIEQVLAAGER